MWWISIGIGHHCHGNLHIQIWKLFPPLRTVFNPEQSATTRVSLITEISHMWPREPWTRELLRLMAYIDLEDSVDSIKTACVKIAGRSFRVIHYTTTTFGRAPFTHTINPNDNTSLFYPYACYWSIEWLYAWFWRLVVGSIITLESGSQCLSRSYPWR